MTLNADRQGRMLLSHNFDVSPELVPALNREAFVAVFQAGLSKYEDLQCKGLAHPHWMVEIRFPMATANPSQIGEWCAQALADLRRSQQVSTAAFPEILILGGLKTSPPTSSDPETLQPGEWGVDVVETASGAAFLQSIAWESTISQRSPDSLFKVEWKEA